MNEPARPVVSLSIRKLDKKSLPAVHLHRKQNHHYTLNSLSQTIAVLSAMISPVVLIMASGSLILTTSQRLSRSIERTRTLSDQMRDMIKESTVQIKPEGELAALFAQLKMATRRARLLQMAMTILYLTLFFFIATCISIGVVILTQTSYTWLPFLLGIVGVALLFLASMILIKESRLAISAVDMEMDQTLQFFRTMLPDLDKEEKLKWWRKLVPFYRERKEVRQNEM
ncbi:DUF2721 domain-containing protein [Aridibaculum aurantiacum]|uniref:DUF2721 domain-containing protein n=1 Tax=Aridibaculum aurantiacum TaxID=2810307 RepID=UPI001A95CA51|nr:DUF2721 domain-containing protein [Aridibaculum aurantiacum]